jgi:hypothetical protein
MAPPPAYSNSTELVPNELLAGQPDGHHQDYRGGADHHAQSGQGKTQLARAEAVHGQLQDLAQHHGAAVARQHLLEIAMAGIVSRLHRLIGYPFRLFDRLFHRFPATSLPCHIGNYHWCRTRARGRRPQRARKRQPQPRPGLSDNEKRSELQMKGAS